MRLFGAIYSVQVEKRRCAGMGPLWAPGATSAYASGPGLHWRRGAPPVSTSNSANRRKLRRRQW